MKHVRVDVCVLGSNPAGLALTGLLARSGIDTLAVSRQTGLSDSPRRQKIDANALMVLRDQGLQPKLDRVARVSQVASESIDVSPLLLTALQLDEAQRLGADVRFGIDVLNVRQDQQAAYVQLRNLRDAEDYEVIADYLVGTEAAWQSMGRRQGRLFCVETSVTDAYTLAWRLAFVIKGQASPRLLDAYEAEAGTFRRGDCVPDVPLQQGHEHFCSLDLIGKGAFTVLTGSGGECWRLAAQKLATELGIEIGVAGIGPEQEAEDPSGRWVKQRGIGADGCLLVRPDGVIALRVKSSRADAEMLLRSSLRRHLGREH